MDVAVLNFVHVSLGPVHKYESIDITDPDRYYAEPARNRNRSGPVKILQINDQILSN